MRPRAAVVGAVLALSVSSCASNDPQRPPPAASDESPPPPGSPGSSAPQSPAVTVTAEGMGALQVSVSALRPAERGWEHDLVLTNTGGETVHVDEHRQGKLLGDDEVLAADEGCGYGSGPGKGVSVLCLANFRILAVQPGQSLSSRVTVFVGLDGMKPVKPDPYRFVKPMRHRVDSPFNPGEKGGEQGTVTITYTGLSA